MIRLKKLSLFQGTKQLLNEADLTLYPGYKCGVVGPNGCGKSSLFQLILGQLSAEKGDIELPPKWHIAAARQETPSSSLTALDYVLQGHQQYWELQESLKRAESAEDGDKIAHIHAALEAIDGWRLPSEAAKLLTGLSFSEAQMQRPVSELSGGWRMRLNLAQALLQPADCLLLDEPTNHLDLEAVLWLQSFLKTYPGMLVVISHDRDFLDTFCSQILSYEDQKLVLYEGNYSSFEKQKATRLSLQQAQFEKQQKEIAHLESFVRRFKAKASKATQAQSRVKALEKMDLVSAVQVRQSFSFQFAPVDKHLTELIRLDQASVGYDQQIILSEIKMVVSAGDRIGLLGRNGEGKSTLIKLICGELAKKSGEVSRSKHFKAGYFAQHQLEQLNSSQSPIWHLQQIDPDASEQELRDYLGGFAFRGDKAFDPVAGFSGGEKARLVLAQICRQAPNLLLLDEPTNHFDIEMREALSLALQEYEGAVILVAHDSSLMQSVVDEFWLVNRGTVNPFNGDLNDYQRWLNENRWGKSGAAHTPGAAGEQNLLNSPGDKGNGSAENAADALSTLSRKEQKRLEAEHRRQKAPITKKIAQIEQEIEQLQQRASDTEAALAEQSIYQAENADKLAKLLQADRDTKSRLGELEEVWLELQDELEALENRLAAELN